MRKVFHCPYGRSEAVVSAFVDAVVARPTNHDAIIEMIGTAKLYVLDVMSLSTFPKLVFGTARFPDLRDRRST